MPLRYELPRAGGFYLRAALMLFRDAAAADAMPYTLTPYAMPVVRRHALISAFDSLMFYFQMARVHARCFGDTERVIYARQHAVDTPRLILFTARCRYAAEKAAEYR